MARIRFTIVHIVYIVLGKLQGPVVDFDIVPVGTGEANAKIHYRASPADLYPRLYAPAFLLKIGGAEVSPKLDFYTKWVYNET